MRVREFMAPSSVDVSADFESSDTRAYPGDLQKYFLSPIRKQKTVILRSRCVFATRHFYLVMRGQ